MENVQLGERTIVKLTGVREKKAAKVLDIGVIEG